MVLEAKLYFAKFFKAFLGLRNYRSPVDRLGQLSGPPGDREAANPDISKHHRRFWMDTRYPAVPN